MIAKLISLERRARAKSSHKAASALTTQRNSTAHIVRLLDYLHRHQGELGQPSILHIGRYINRQITADSAETLDKSIGHRFTRNLVSQAMDDQNEEMRLHSVPHDHDIAEHGVLSWPRDEYPTSEQIERATDKWCAALDIHNCPRICVVHIDSAHVHCHVAVVRVDIETGKIAPMGNGWAKYASQIGVAQAAFENGWTNEPNAIFVTDARGTYERLTGLRVAETHGGAERNALANARRKRREVEEERLELEPDSLNFERKTGQYSDERIAKTMAKQRILRAKSWQELHTSCAQIGITYLPSPSGARLHFGHAQIAASAAYANAALKRVEQRLGTFVPPPADMVVRRFVRPVLEIIEDDEARQQKLEKEQDKAEKEELKRKLDDAKRAIDRYYSDEQYVAAKSKGSFEQKLSRRKFIAAERRREADVMLYCSVQIMQRSAFEKLTGPNLYEFGRALFWGDEDDRKIGFNSRQVEQIAPAYKVDDAEDGWYFLNKDGHLAMTVSPCLIMQKLGCTDEDTRTALVLAAARWEKVEVYGSPSRRKEIAKMAGELGVSMSDPKLAKVAFEASVAARKRYEAEQKEAQDIIAKVGKSLQMRHGEPQKLYTKTVLSMTQINELSWQQYLDEWRIARARGANNAELAKIIDQGFDESLTPHLRRMEQLNKDELSAIRNNEKSRFRYLINTNPIRYAEMTDKEYQLAWKAAKFNARRASRGW